MKAEPCAQKRIVVTPKELPLCCPREGERVWDGHPRVYLDIDEKGHVHCPYCETEYVLNGA